MSGAVHSITIRPASGSDLPQVLAFIRELAVYEHLEHQVVATDAIQLLQKDGLIPPPPASTP